jgi:hypothetical protein
MNFMASMQARKEMQSAFSQKITHHAYFSEVVKTPEATKVPLWLPITH